MEKFREDASWNIPPAGREHQVGIDARHGTANRLCGQRRQSNERASSRPDGASWCRWSNMCMTHWRSRCACVPAPGSRPLTSSRTESHQDVRAIPSASDETALARLKCSSLLLVARSWASLVSQPGGSALPSARSLPVGRTTGHTRCAATARAISFRSGIVGRSHSGSSSQRRQCSFPDAKHSGSGAASSVVRLFFRASDSRGSLPLTWSDDSSRCLVLLGNRFGIYLWSFF